MIGARQEGVKGFVKGSVRGLSGVLIKPVSGALDLLMKTTEGAHSMVNFQHYDSLKQNLPNNLQKLNYRPTPQLSEKTKLITLSVSFHK